MSRVIIYRFHGAQGKVQEVGSAHNVDGFWTFVWKVLSAKYGARNSEEIWRLMKDNRLLDWERSVLASTYEFTVVMQHNIPMLRDHMRTFYTAYGLGFAQTIPEMVGFLLSEQRRKGTLAVGFGNDLTGNPWRVKDPFRRGASRAYRLLRDDRHIELLERARPTKH
jgi:hypothetical protein